MTKSTRRALLSSVVALVICVTMLVGTTFAWFTDTASTAVNTIQSGKLDVELLDKNGNSLEGKTLNFVKAEGHENEAILWEPGCTYYTEPFSIYNNGNLALKYEIVVTGIEGDTGLLSAIDFELVYRDGEHYEISLEDVEESYNLPVNSQTQPICLKAHMKEEAGNEYQGLTLDNIAITVYATQYTKEYDSTTNQYDNDATFSNGANVITTDATLNGTYIALDDNGNDPGDKNAVYVKGGNVVIEGGYYDGRSGGNNAAVRVDAGATLTIKDGYFTVGTDKKGNGNNLIYADGGKITIEGGTFYAPYTYDNRYWALNCKDSSNGSITVMGGKFYKFNPAEASTKGTTSYVGEKEITVADGYKVVQDGDWYYVVSEDATVVSTADELAKAVAKGGDVVVTSDITIDSYINITASTNLYLYDNTITRTTGATGIYVGTEGVVVNIYGNGNVVAPNEGVFVGAGTVNIYGGTYTSLQAVYVVGTGVVNIYGGTFKSENTEYGSAWILNQLDKDRATSSINVMGGTFIGFNPADNAAEGEGTNFVADGYTVTEVNGTYVVSAN